MARIALRSINAPVGYEVIYKLVARGARSGLQLDHLLGREKRQHCAFIVLVVGRIGRDRRRR